ncbi:hypothetical protein ACFX13_002354 [Malus domestica]
MMGRSSATASAWCDDDQDEKSSTDTMIKKGPWTPEEDQKLVEYLERYGHGSWRALPKLAGLNRCGKSCRLRWTNYLRPDIKRGNFSQEEEQTILNLHSLLGNKWSAIASNLPGRTDNEIKNFWNTHLKKKLLKMGIDPVTHNPISTTGTNIDHHQYLMIINQILSSLAPQLLAASSSSSCSSTSTCNPLMLNNPWEWDRINNINNNVNMNALLGLHLSDAKTEVLQTILQEQLLSTGSPPNNSNYVEAALNYLLGSSSYSYNNSVPDDHHQQICGQYHSHHHPQSFSVNIGAPVHTNTQFSHLSIPNIIHKPPHLLEHDQQPLPVYVASSAGPASNLIYTAGTMINKTGQQLGGPSSGSYSYATPTVASDHHQLPLLVPSPECSAANINLMTGNKIVDTRTNNPNTNQDHVISDPNSRSTSTTSTTFEAWGDLMDHHDEPTNHSYWKHIILDPSLQTWPIS